MRVSLRFFLLVLVFFLIFGALWISLTNPGQVSAQQPATALAPAAGEEAYRENNLGVALLEQFNYKDAVEAFRSALKIDSQLKIAQINLAIALFNLPDYEAATQEAQKAARMAPERPQPFYILGLIARAQNRQDDAIAAFKRVLEFDPQDVGTNINLGQIHMEQRKYGEAVTFLRTAVAAEPYNSTALYNLATALLRDGKREEGQQLMARFQTLRQSGAATSISLNYLEQGRYAEAVTSTGGEPELVSRAVPEARFTEATGSIFSNPARRGKTPPQAKSAFGRRFQPNQFSERAKREIIDSLSGTTLLFDFDADGDLDLFTGNSAAVKLYRNEAGKFIDVTAQSGLLTKAPGGAVVLGAFAGDFDNDEKTDLFVLRYGASSLYRNEGGGRFRDATASAKIPNYPHLAVSAAFVDVDHDGDLDIFIAGLADLNKTLSKGQTLTFPESFAGAPHMLLRNNGDGTFADQTGSAKIAGTDRNNSVAVIPFDYDNRRDIDLLVVNYSAAPQLFRNLRDGTFREIAGEIGLSEKASGAGAAAGDVNKDGFTDFFFGRGTLALSDGKEKYSILNVPAAGENYSAAQFLDYDNDGLLDLVAATASGLEVYRNLGGGREWDNVSGRAVGANLKLKENWSARGFSSGDLDGDGDLDLITLAPAKNALFARNEGGNRNHSVRVRLAGKVSNRSGIGAKIEARAGSLVQKLETYSATPAPAPSEVHFGLGQRALTDTIRVLWTAGIVQAETEIASGKTGASAASVTVTEIDRKPSSCPYLYVWNGREFEFVTDFMGGGELGYWVAPGIRAAPDPDEYVRIRGDQLKEQNGRFQLRVTNELEEALFVDHLKLLVVAHPGGTEVYPNEGLGNPTSSSFKLYSTENARPPVSAFDDKGVDVLEKLEKIDRRYPDNFKLHRIRGYAEEHALTLNLGKTNAKRILLLMNGWTDYAFSSDNVAAAQSGMSLKAPALQVRDERGRWKTVIENIGIPVGRPQTVTVDLTGKFLSASREVRIVTNMRIYWDQILVDNSGGDAPTKIETLEPVVADLRWRGFSAEKTPDGREPYGYDYGKVSFTSPWKTMPGRYTREGDVRELLRKIDDMFVVSRPGDEIKISFDATKLEPLPEGWTRTFLLYTDGFSKEMDINSASPDQLLPLPFHGMKDYPYQAPESYPTGPEHQRYLELYNTRVVKTQMPRLEILSANH